MMTTDTLHVAHTRRKLLGFDDIPIGRKQRLSRTISGADVDAFGHLSGDLNPLHMDEAFAATTPFGQRVAHGLCVLSIASGLAVQSGIMEGTVMAFREINDWKFSLPVFIGDTIHVEMEVLETKAFPRLGGGAVTISLDVHNQDGKSAQKGKWVVLMMSQPKS